MKTENGQSSGEEALRSSLAFLHEWSEIAAKPIEAPACPVQTPPAGSAHSKRTNERTESAVQRTDERTSLFLEEEKYFYRIGIRTKVELREKTVVLMVPSKDAVWAKEYVEGGVKEIVAPKKEQWVMFDEDLQLKNKKLENKKNVRYRIIRNRTFLSGVIVLAFLSLVSLFFRLPL